MNLNKAEGHGPEAAGIPSTTGHRARRWLSSIAVALGLVWASTSAHAFPNGPVTIIVPAPAGSSTDNSARVLGNSLSKTWGVPVVIDNRPGAGSSIGINAVAKAPADGQTLLLAATSIVQAPHLYQKPQFEIKSVVPVVQVAQAPLILAVNTTVSARTVKEFIELAKAAPGTLSYASPGAGTGPHMMGSVLVSRAGIDLLHVPYRGSAPAVNDVAGGRISSIFGPYSVLAPYVQNGKMRLLATNGLKRSAQTPDVPTMAEAGIPGFEEVGFEGIFAPAGTPAPVVEKIARSVREAIATPEVRGPLALAGLVPTAGTPAEFAKLISEQFETWGRVVKENRLSLD
jgi:tripartite-type tricarboxylate transporter receptor subunit TctC